MVACAQYLLRTVVWLFAVEGWEELTNIGDETEKDNDEEDALV